ncbi:MAG: cell envelope integrity protein TolA [Gammaproteobacteria bacterium]
MITAKIKLLASLYTIALLGSIVALLLFGGFRFKSPVIKGKVIQATVVDISQLQPKKVKNTPPKKKDLEIKKTQPEVKKSEPPKEKTKEPPPVKKDPPVEKKIEPVVDTKAQELERKKRLEREKKLEEIRQKRKEAEERRKKEEENLKKLIEQEAKVEQPEEQSTPVAHQKGQTDDEQLNQLMVQYQLAVISAVQRQWSIPPSENKNLLCHVKVRQTPGGFVVDATISSPCNANSVVKQSIIAAIKKAEPLPYKGFEKVFSRTATFIFEPKE